MANLDVIICELEWQRLRRRMMKHKVKSILLFFGTWAVITVLKLAPRADYIG